MRRSRDRLMLSGLLLLPEALSFEFDAVGVVDEAIEDRVGDGGVSDDFVPAIDGQLAGDDDRTGFVSILDDFEQITALVGVEGFWSPVVQDQQVKSCDRPQHPGIASVGAAECEGGEETRHTMVGNGEVVPASLVAEGASKPTLADAAWPSDEEIMPRPDPVAGPCGVGKSWLACALGHKACRDDFADAYHRVPRLFAALALGRADGRYTRMLRAIARLDMLILDDWVPEPLDSVQRRVLHENV